MDPRIEAALDEWRIRACDPGYAGLNALADAEFTGAMTTDGAVGFMVNGRLVGMAGGTTEAFWGADFTALEADGPALPLLCAMLTASAQEEGEYYTGETPISDVDETLSSGGFTGYIDLSENVFSGDYFVIYYGGTSFSAAFLGTEDRIVTGAEARERAAEEVGIFTVNSVKIDVIEIPAPDVDDSATPDQPATPDELDAELASGESNADAESLSGSASLSPEPSPQRSQDTTGPSETARLARAALGVDPSRIGADSPSSNGATDEVVTVPALDPARTGRPESTEPVNADTPEPSARDASPTSSEAEGEQPSSGQTAELEAALEEAEAENERLRERIDELETRIADLQAEEQVGQSLEPAVALDGTNLFVRYQTKTNFTLPDALKGTSSREEVSENLQLERHTTFETDELTVDGDPYDAFLEGSTAYQFSQWLLGDLLFEIVEGGDEKAFAGLVEAIPEIDRIEFQGDVPVHTKDADERQATTYSFDLVCRNSMGDPVLVAQVHDARTPVSGESVGQLLADANNVAGVRTSLGGAFFVSRSYFEPEALETVADATGGSLLRGGSRQSYVSVSRKHGFHLCLVEARDGSFHLSIPED